MCDDQTMMIRRGCGVMIKELFSMKIMNCKCSNIVGLVGKRIIIKNPTSDCLERQPLICLLKADCN